jgi:hypothetical protein
VTLNLLPGTVSTIAGKSLNISVGTVIENAYGGDGNDVITGNNADNVLYGMRGNDTLIGGSGLDTAAWKHAAANYQLSMSNGTWKVSDKTGVDGVDSLMSIERLQFSDRVVIMDSQSHPSYAGLPSELYQFFITAFNAAPGVTYMNQLAEAYSYGLSIKDIVEIFTTKAQFTSVYSPSLSHLDMATLLMNNIVKSSATDVVKSSAIKDVKDALDFGWSVGRVIYQVFGNLAHMPLTDPSWGNTTKQFNNEIAVAKYFTEVLNQSTTDLETLREVILPVTAATDVSSDAAIAQLIGVALMTGGLPT